MNLQLILNRLASRVHTDQTVIQRVLRVGLRFEMSPLKKIVGKIISDILVQLQKLLLVFVDMFPSSR